MSGRQNAPLWQGCSCPFADSGSTPIIRLTSFPLDARFNCHLYTCRPAFARSPWFELRRSRDTGSRPFSYSSSGNARNYLCLTIRLTVREGSEHDSFSRMKGRPQHGRRDGIAGRLDWYDTSEPCGFQAFIECAAISKPRVTPSILAVYEIHKGGAKKSTVLEQRATAHGSRTSAATRMAAWHG